MTFYVQNVTVSVFLDVLLIPEEKTRSACSDLLSCLWEELVHNYHRFDASLSSVSSDRRERASGHRAPSVAADVLSRTWTQLHFGTWSRIHVDGTLKLFIGSTWTIILELHTLTY